jgi:formiminoglutamase
MSLAPVTIAPPNSEPDDPRVGHLLGRALAPEDAAQVALLGFPVDQGVQRNGGRSGAAEGPRALREQLYRLCPDAREPELFSRLLAHTRDLGDLISTGDLERDQAELARVLGPLLRAGTFVIVLGGGHETSYGHFLGYVEAQRDVSIQNIDAHADVRALKQGLGHSGSPFRQAIEHASGRLQRYGVAGLSPQGVAHGHLTFMREHGAHFSFREDFKPGAKLYGGAGSWLATFCLDAVDQAFAPGVSAPACDGLPPGEWLAAAYQAGRSASVSSADLVELNPRFDRDGQTARLAARTVWEILRGRAELLAGAAFTQANP